MPTGFAAPDPCPVCGASVPRGSRACPECGADERTGWDDDKTRYDGLDLPDEAFADDRTESEKPAHRRQGRPLHWWLAAAVAAAVLVYLALVQVR